MSKNKKYKLPKAWTTVTPLSRIIALCLFIIAPIGGFYLGIYYQKTTHQGYPNIFCKKWETVCQPNLVDPQGKCAAWTICVDPSTTPTPYPSK